MDIDKIIASYNAGNGTKELCASNKIGFVKLTRILSEHGVKIRTRQEAGKIYPRKALSESHKQNISKARVAYLSEHPDKVPYRLYHSSNYISYPHKRLMKALTDIGIIDWISEYQIHLYSYDIAFPDIKLDIEIDGNTHKNESVINIDNKRDAYSKMNGWTVRRFTASEVNTNLDMCVNEIIKIIYTLNPLYKKYDIETWETIKENIRNYRPQVTPLVCKQCTIEFIPSYKNQIFCNKRCSSAYKGMLICKRPSKDILIDDLVTLHTFIKIGTKYNVSDKTIRDWCDYHCIDYKALKKSLQTG